MRLTAIPRLLSAALAAIAVLLVAAVAAPTVSAHIASFGAQHTLTASASAGSNVFAGQLNSDLAACLSARSITLYLRVVDASVLDQAAGTTSTDSRGAWSKMLADAQAGDYYAAAAGTVLKTPGHRHTCELAKSNTVTVPPDGDADGIKDGNDNCPSAPNRDQRDGDGDGQGDCDDTHPRVNPAQSEIDDGIDNDCDGATDEGFDADGDGYTPRRGDCNDNNAQIHPATDDPTNGIDDNCDGIIDGTAASHTCWMPSSEPITATATWSQVETMEPCTWTLDTYSGYWLGSVFMVSAAWWAEYTPTFDGFAVAFRYWDMDWTFVAIGAFP